MGLDRRLLPVISAALLATVTTLAQERTAMRVSIGGSDIPDAAQPRVVVESQRGSVAVARIEVSGVPGAVFAAGVAPGDFVEIAAYFSTSRRCRCSAARSCRWTPSPI